jgi:hypothetical protein
MSSDGNVQFVEYSTNAVGGMYSSTGAHIFSVTVMSGYGNMPFSDASTQMMVLLPNAYDVISTVVGGALNLTRNVYDSQGSNNYSIFDVTQQIFETNTANNFGVSVSAPQQLSANTGSFGTEVNGDTIVIVPYRCFGTIGINAMPAHAFMSPPFGIRLNDMAQKVFELFRLQIKGQGTLNVYGFKDGNITYLQCPMNCLPDETHSFQINSNPITLTNQVVNGVKVFQPNSYQQMVHLKGLTAKYMRFMIWMVRGTGWFEIQDITCYSREMEELSNT